MFSVPFLEQIYKITKEFINVWPKEIRKNYGQFFTEPVTAAFMANFFASDNSSVRILDPGCGNGMLSAAAVLALISAQKKPDEIDLTLFEIDEKIIPVLHTTLQILADFCANYSVKFIYHIQQSNFILYHNEAWHSNTYVGTYDFVICNPPYKKIRKCADEAVCMSDLVYGQPNLYSLFMCMAVRLLKPEGEMVFIIPRSWTSGLYFKKIRSYLFDSLSLEHIHLFASRDKVFNADSVLQETMILHARKTTGQTPRICISSSPSSQYRNVETFSVSSASCFPPNSHRFLLVPVSEQQETAVWRLSAFKETFSSLGYKFKTGPVIEFRAKNVLLQQPCADSVPLVQACNCTSSHVKLDVDTAKSQYLLCSKPALYFPAHNSIYIRRFTTKEERRRLLPSMFLCSRFPAVNAIALENHLNYLVNENRGVSEAEIYGIYVLLSSDLWDSYYRALNGSTQVNAEELNSMPVPDHNTICLLGAAAIQMEDETGTIDSDRIIKEILPYE